jgi:hypothetical protein
MGNGHGDYFRRLAHGSFRSTRALSQGPRHVHAANRPDGMPHGALRGAIAQRDGSPPRLYKRMSNLFIDLSARIVCRTILLGMLVSAKKKTFYLNRSKLS